MSVNGMVRPVLLPSLPESPMIQRGKRSGFAIGQALIRPPRLTSYESRSAAISLQVLPAKALQCALTQNIRVALALFRKVDNSFCDEFVSLMIKPVGKSEGYASHFECDTHDARGLAIKLHAVQK